MMAKIFQNLIKTIISQIQERQGYLSKINKKKNIPRNRISKLGNPVIKRTSKQHRKKKRLISYEGKKRRKISDYSLEKKQFRKQCKNSFIILKEEKNRNRILTRKHTLQK